MFLTFRDVWNYRHLILTFTTRNLKLKYKSSIFGFLWSLITPLLMMMVYTVVFSYIIRIQVDFPYVVFVLCGLLPWTFFASSLSLASNAILENANLIKKVFFPRVTIPIASVLSNLVNLGVSLILLFGFMGYYDILPNIHITLFPLVILVHLIFTIGLALFFSSLTVFFRDLQHILEIILTIWFYSTPVIYPVSLLSGKLRAVLLLNPMTAIVELYRSVLLYQTLPPDNPSWSSLWLTAWIWTIVFLVIGSYVFRRLEHRFVREL